MARVRRATVLAVVFLAACAPQAKPSEQFGPDALESDLTAARIKRYFNSYPAIRAMASRYWGERRYSPPSKILPPQGTFDRALLEMEAAGALPDFELLLQAYGYYDRTTWLQINERIAYAYAELHLGEKYPERAKRRKDERARRRKALVKERAKLQDLPEGRRAERTKSLDTIERELERDLLAERDAEAIRPFSAYFEKIDEHRPSGQK